MGLMAALVSIASAHAADGQQLVKSKCTTCHTEKKALDGVRKVEADQRAAHFDKFFSTHFAPDAAQRGAIVEYLVKAVGN
jgi:mono/diheme cytochrome c family protein